MIAYEARSSTNDAQVALEGGEGLCAVFGDGDVILDVNSGHAFDVNARPAPIRA